MHDDSGAPPGRGRRRTAIALALSIGVHLLAVVFWPHDRVPTGAAPMPIAMPMPMRAVTITLQPIPPPPSPRHEAGPGTHARARAAQGAYAEQPARGAASKPPTPPRAERHDTPTSDTIRSETDRSNADRADAASATPADSSPPNAPPAPPASAADMARLATEPATGAGGSFTAGLAKRQAGRVDRALRGGKSGVPQEADTPWARFVRGLEDAHVDTSTTGGLDSYTSPDGVVIYRLTVGKKVICTMTGSVGKAGPVNCPSDVPWHREE